jgi:hypothetical protein
MRKIILRIPKSKILEYIKENNLDDYDYENAVIQFVKEIQNKIIDIKILTESDNFFVVEVIKNMKPYKRNK